MAHEPGHKMNIGNKEKNTPGNFSEKDNNTISNSTIGKMASTSFSVDPNKGATLKTKVTSTTTPIRSTQSVQKKSTSNLANYQKGLKNLGPNFKPTKAQTAAANKKVAELKKKDAAAAKYNASIKKSNPKSTSTTKINKKVNPTTAKQINKESKQRVSSAIGKENFRRYGVEMQAKKDSVAASERYIGSKIKFLGKKPNIDKRIKQEAGKYGNKAANTTRRKGFVKTVKPANRTGFGPYSRKGGYLIK